MTHGSSGCTPTEAEADYSPPTAGGVSMCLKDFAIVNVNELRPKNDEPNGYIKIYVTLNASGTHHFEGARVKHPTGLEYNRSVSPNHREAIVN